MSQIAPGSTKTANAHVNPPPALGWDVFVTPRMPIVTPAGRRARAPFFQVMAWTGPGSEDFRARFRTAGGRTGAQRQCH